MDIVSHALAGAAAGAVVGHPVAGAVLGVLPDAVLGIKRRQEPNTAYNVTHSLLFVAVCWMLEQMLFGTSVSLIALMSHLLLDIPTHGKKWAPPLLYPFDDIRFSLGEEWEWFSPSWNGGLVITSIWIFLCLLALI